METLIFKKNRLHGNICTVDRLKKYIKLTPREEKEIRKVTKIHPMLLSRYYLSLIKKGGRNDPLRKMMIPSGQEINLAGTYDTSGESLSTKMPGLQHKYGQTALILSTNRCAAYCRFCFRKRLVGLTTNEILNRFNKAVDYIKKHEEIDNVLISGGDSLMLPSKVIGQFLKLLAPISHLRYIRFGTRIPAVFPGRIIKDKKLLAIFKKYSKKKHIYIVTHFNHPREITPKSRRAVKALLAAGIAGVNNQAVLMKGVNDNPRVLAKLLNKLIKINVLPYYVFQCRPVKRVKHHFQISLYRGYKIFEEAKRKVKGHILCKRLKYVMSHRSGKVEIIGMDKKRMYFKYHQARNPKDLGRCFSKKINKKASWLDDFK